MRPRGPVGDPVEAIATLLIRAGAIFGFGLTAAYVLWIVGVVAGWWSA